MKSMFWITGLLLSGANAAENWRDYKDTFSSFPCSDGWAGCSVEGKPVDLGRGVDSVGRFHPMDMRVGFFDFEPLPGFSPFVELTVYEMMEELPEPELILEAPPKPGVVLAQDPSKAPPFRPPPEPSWTPPLPPEPSWTPPPEPVPEPEAVVEITREPVPEPIPEPEAVPEPESVPEPTSPPPPVEQTGCDNLVQLEAAAMMGQVKPGQRQCLEKRVNSDESLTNKRQVSRVLINDAFGRRDMVQWERLVKRHLQKYDQSDPNMCFAYAIHISKKGSAYSTQVIRWTEKALENKQLFSAGADFKKKVYSLYQLRSFAAKTLWEAAEKTAVSERTEGSQADAKKYRGMTKNFSREWLDYARASGQQTKRPMTLCVAASNMEFCKG